MERWRNTKRNKKLAQFKKHCNVETCYLQFLGKNTFLDTQRYIPGVKTQKVQASKQNIASSYSICKFMHVWTLLDVILNREQKQRERKAERVTGLQAFGTGAKWNHMHFKSIPNKYSHFPFCSTVDTISRHRLSASLHLLRAL